MNFVSQNILLYCSHSYGDVSYDSVEVQMRRATPRPRSGAAAMLYWSSHEEIPNVQGKRNPSKMIVLLKSGLENFEHYFTRVSDECNCAVVLAFFGIAFLWNWNEN